MPLDDQEPKKLPGYKGDEAFHHVSTHVYSGGSEGLRINIDIVKRNGTIQNVASAKSFDSRDEAWKMAQAITDMVESIYLYGDRPAIISMLNAIPKAKWSNHTPDFESLSDVRVERKGETLDVSFKHASGNSGYQYEGYNAYHLDALGKDWLALFERNNVIVSRVNPEVDNRFDLSI